MQIAQWIASMAPLSLALVVVACQNPSHDGDSSSEAKESGYSFEAAIDNTSTVWPIVRIQLANSPSAEAAQTCVVAALLVQAIQVEHGLPDDFRGRERASQIAKSTASHRFVFKKREAKALLKVRWFDDRQAAVACRAISAGRPAMIGDYAPYLYLGDGKGGWIQAD